MPCKHEPRRGGFRDDGKRQWLGRQVWVVDKNGKRHKGILWFAVDTDVLIRRDGRARLLTLPEETEGIRWGFAEDGDKM